MPNTVVANWMRTAFDHIAEKAIHRRDFFITGAGGRLMRLRTDPAKHVEGPDATPR